MKKRLAGSSIVLLLALGGCSDSGLPGPTEVTSLSPRTVAELVTPFDVSRNDLVGPDHHDAQYGARPRIVALADGAEIDVLVEDQGVDLDAGERPRAVLLRLVPDAGGYAVGAALQMPMLDRIMGLARADNGDYFFATAVHESAHRELSRGYPGRRQYRAHVVHVFRIRPDGDVVFDVDVDLARAAAAENPEQLINPMVASSARLAFGGSELALVHGNNTSPDDNGVRHQKAVSTLLDATTGAIRRTSSIWVSHSFDQRLLHDGRGFMEIHLGDAYPRQVAFTRVDGGGHDGSYPAFFIKGETGNNNSYSRLGGIAQVETDPAYGYVALFASERTPAEPSAGKVGGPRDLGWVRIRADFEELDGEVQEHVDPTQPHTLDVISGGQMRSSRLRWLTDLGAQGTVSAERPKLVGIGGDRYLILWESWEDVSSGHEFVGSHALLVDAHGDTLTPTLDLGAIHLPRGDDAFALGGGAAFVTGDEVDLSLTVHSVTESGGTLSLTSALVR